MEIIWSITQNDIRKVKEVISSNQNAFLQARKERNVHRLNLQINKDAIIRALLMCLLTSQQRSGPDSVVGNFLGQSPFPVTYEKIQQSDNIEFFVKDTLTDHDLTRFLNRISKFFTSNIKKFQENNWAIISELKNLAEIDSKTEERRIADKYNDELKGLGPKQARNFLQALGLTKYEIPIDSRITNWLNEFGFPVSLSSSPLGDVGYYHFVLDGIQELCKKAQVYPCLLDAAIFSSFDNNGWTKEKVRF
ncbi:hypothetical protein [Gracilimonas sp.]|uniref:hypothetical protein n=1 Tax=Gracilimonas sp. TaxID=1974203 RepID=UPI0028712070|nr:hypothetical protein [Gracilimonas sp.]